MDINHILEYVRKINPSMTKNRLIEELSKSQYSTVALIIACENNKKSTCRK